MPSITPYPGTGNVLSALEREYQSAQAAIASSTSDFRSCHARDGRISSHEAVEAIHAFMSGTEWDSDTTAAIADILAITWTGRPSDPNEDADGIDFGFQKEYSQ
jgi:hypothetical protein